MIGFVMAGKRTDRKDQVYEPVYKEDKKGVFRDQLGRMAPGQSLNKGNGPTGPKALAKYVRASIGQGGEKLVDAIVSILDGKGANADGVIMPVTTRNRIDAATWLADRGFGKSVETINLNDATGAGPDALSEQSVDALHKRRELLLQLKELDTKGTAH